MVDDQGEDEDEDVEIMGTEVVYFLYGEGYVA